ncbi:MAG: hypothetical protein IPJ88_17735 [Myxococcales bacterium]|nr:MAG: hypothetical protein IPJ88_17735 [Myxococcales bacterium]
MELNTETLRPIVFLVAGGLFFIWLERIGSRWFRSLRARFRAKRWQKGENKALRMLSAAGYRIQSTQDSRTWTLFVNEKPLSVKLRADAIVERHGQRYVAEIKTGSKAPQIQNSATRRQLLEYACAYGASGVLLVDAENEQIHHVQFDLPEQNTAIKHSPFAWAWLIALLSIAVAVYLRSRS